MSLSRHIAILAIALSGVVHLFIVPGQFSNATVHGIFFILLGLAQIAWAAVFWRSRSNAAYVAGLGLSGGIIALWVLTVLVSVPYASTAQPIGLSQALSKAGELI